MALAIAPAVHASEATAIPADYTIVPLSVAQYHAMVAAGILEEGAPIELLEGYLVEKITKHPPHRLATQLVERKLSAILPPGFHTASQEPITLADSEPEPDIAVLRGDIYDYGERHPYAKEVCLVVEIADATLQRDRISKRRIYARAGIVSYWIVNLVDRFVEVYTMPSGNTLHPSYRNQQSYGEDDLLELIIDGEVVGRLAVRSILP
jgi:hypothetical protein